MELQKKHRKGNNGRYTNDDREDNPPKEEDDPLKDATTLYVGNLSFYTTEEQIHELFSKYVALVLSPAPGSLLTNLIDAARSND